MAEINQEQIDIAARCQLKLMQRFERLLDDESLSPADAKTLKDLLVHNGWTLDPSALPKGLRDKLTAGLDPDDIEDPRLRVVR